MVVFGHHWNLDLMIMLQFIHNCVNTCHDGSSNIDNVECWTNHTVRTFNDLHSLQCVFLCMSWFCLCDIDCIYILLAFYCQWFTLQVTFIHWLTHCHCPLAHICQWRLMHTNKFQLPLPNVDWTKQELNHWLSDSWIRRPTSIVLLYQLISLLMIHFKCGDTRQKHTSRWPESPLETRATGTLDLMTQVQCCTFSDIHLLLMRVKATRLIQLIRVLCL